MFLVPVVSIEEVDRIGGHRLRTCQDGTREGRVSANPLEGGGRSPMPPITALLPPAQTYPSPLPTAAMGENIRMN